MAAERPVPKILLAEDDGDDRTFFVEFLGNRPDISLLPIVANGVEMLQYLNAVSTEAERPDIIVLDQNMPKLTGKETLAALKQDGKNSEIPVIVYTTYAGHQLIEECVRLGAAMVMVKPDSREGYNQMMDEILLTCQG